jgi:PKD repeat protein
VNHLVNYGWEYVWHCHLLGHEEFDMMRSMAVAVAPGSPPDTLSAGNVSPDSVFLAWNDTTTTETHWTIQNSSDGGVTWGDVERIPSATGPQTNKWAMAIISGLPANSADMYRVLATNVVGDDTAYTAPSSGYPTVAVNSTNSTPVVATNGNPLATAGFTFAPGSGNAPLTVEFTDTSTGSPKGWSWDFGDNDATNSTLQNPVHTYATEGTYHVSLTAMTIGGNNTPPTQSIIVGTGGLTLPPVANFTATPLRGTAPLTVQFRDNSTNMPTTWNWSFGDYWMANGINMSNSTVMNPTHTYLRAGNYTVNLTVSNAAGSDTKNRYWFITVTNATDKIGIYNNGTWYLDYDGNGTWDGPAIDKVYTFGGPGNTSVLGDWNGDGKTKVGVYQNGSWFLDYNGDGFYSPGIDAAYTFGGPGNTSVVGDWNGDGRSKIGVTDGINWYLDMNGNGVWDGPSADRYGYFGIPPGFKPIVGDWNGDGKTEIGVTDGLDWYLDTNGNGVWDGTGPGGDQHGFFGIPPAYKPIVGDWNGDGRTKIGVTDGINWYLDTNGNGVWDGPSVDQHGFFGIPPAYKPIVGDWNGDGKDEIGVTNDVDWYLDMNGNGVWDGPVIDKAPYFGITGWSPVVGKW